MAFKKKTWHDRTVGETELSIQKTLRDSANRALIAKQKPASEKQILFMAALLHQGNISPEVVERKWGLNYDLMTIGEASRVITFCKQGMHLKLFDFPTTYQKSEGYRFGEVFMEFNT